MQQSETHFQKTYMLLFIIFKLKVKGNLKAYSSMSSLFLAALAAEAGAPHRAPSCMCVETVNTWEPVQLKNDDVMVFFEHI